jgi:arabinan endo-1,5-alpha-L-arabinosidase
MKMKYIVLIFCFGAMLLIINSSFAQFGDVRNVHDPFLIKDPNNNKYYIICTGKGLPIRTSSDLIHWKKAGQVFQNLPAWASQEIPDAKFPWAPGLIYKNGRFLLYYALSTFGSNESCIALITNRTLDKDNPNYFWKDEGIVLRSKLNDEINAIDPNPVLDSNGNLWLAYGSHREGLRIRRLDPETGKLDKKYSQVFKIANRPQVHAIEAPHIIKHNGWYYLFVSFDHCCQGVKSDYNIRVGRSLSITGPYLGMKGGSMMEGGGSLILSTKGRFIGPGHNSFLQEGPNDWLVYHYYDGEKNGAHTLQIRKITWSQYDWPIVGSPITPGPEDPNNVEKSLMNDTSDDDCKNNR